MGKLCQLLEISRSGYYAWLRGGESARKKANQALLRELVRLHEKYPCLLYTSDIVQGDEDILGCGNTLVLAQPATGKGGRNLGIHPFKVRAVSGRVYGCLLYTSRCV